MCPYYKEAIDPIPIVGSGVRKIWTAVRRLRLRLRFRSPDYWEARYASGGNSGSGSYGHLAEFKAAVLNDFVAKNEIRSVIEFGCGDGHQLSLSKYPQYVGIDVSQTAVKRCQEFFQDDQSKTFLVAGGSGATSEKADLALSLDVIYHLVEDAIYERYMRSLFDAATSFVIIYSDNHEASDQASHVRHRRFTDWIGINEPGWKMVEHIPNSLGSWSDFWVYARARND